jgi:hypothetical protein
VDIATAAGRDSNQMRSISLVTMVFLPGTFFAVRNLSFIPLRLNIFTDKYLREDLIFHDFFQLVAIWERQ